jgi:hypothetical protein
MMIVMNRRSQFHQHFISAKGIGKVLYWKVYKSRKDVSRCKISSTDKTYQILYCLKDCLSKSRMIISGQMNSRTWKKGDMTKTEKQPTKKWKFTNNWKYIVETIVYFVTFEKEQVRFKLNMGLNLKQSCHLEYNDFHGFWSLLARRLFLSWFRPLLKQALFFEAAGQ